MTEVSWKRNGGYHARQASPWCWCRFLVLVGGRRFGVGTDSTVLNWEYLPFTARKSG